MQTIIKYFFGIENLYKENKANSKNGKNKEDKAESEDGVKKENKAENEDVINEEDKAENEIGIKKENNAEIEDAINEEDKTEDKDAITKEENLFIAIRLVIATFALVISQLVSNYYKVENYFVCILFIVCNTLLWPIIFYRIHKWFSDMINSINKTEFDGVIKYESNEDTTKNESQCESLKEVYDKYMKQLMLEPAYIKAIYIFTAVVLNAWVIYKGDFYGVKNIWYLALCGFFVISLIASYSVVLLIAVNTVL